MTNVLISGLKNRAIQVLFLTAIYLLLASYLPIEAHQGLYTLSMLIKDILIWVLPLTVGLFIAHTICAFEQRAPLFIFALLFFEAFSNFSSVWYAYAAGHLASGHLDQIHAVAVDYGFEALWRLPLKTPSWWSADKGSLAGLCLGCMIAFSKNALLKRKVEQGKQIAQWMLTHFFSRLIPLFVLGFVARMYQTRVLQHLFLNYAQLLVWLVFFLALYIAVLFVAGSAGSLTAALRAFKNLTPAGAIAFTSGCSLSTMPVTIEGTAKNLQNPDFAKAVIPATTNIQQIGDCIANTFLCFLIYRHFYGHNPDLMVWTSFSIVFILARFATAAVLGGAIFIMLPIYESYLSFNPEMIALILAFNVILDPLITSSNVMANGALCRIFEKLWVSVLKIRSVNS